MQRDDGSLLALGAAGLLAAGTLLSGRRGGSRSRLFAASAKRREHQRFTALYDSLQAVLRAITQDGWSFGVEMDRPEDFGEYLDWIKAAPLPFIAGGFTRLAFDLGDGRVLKVDRGFGGVDPDDPYYRSWNGEPSGANLREAAVWARATPRQRDWLVPVLEVDPKGRWIVMEKVEPLWILDEDNADESDEELFTLLKTVPPQVRRVAEELGVAAGQVAPPNLDTHYRLLDYEAALEPSP